MLTHMCVQIKRAARTHPHAQDRQVYSLGTHAQVLRLHLQQRGGSHWEWGAGGLGVVVVVVKMVCGYDFIILKLRVRPR